MHILAVDLGVRSCGYVICKIKSFEPSLVAEGEINPKPKLGFPEKLNLIFSQLKQEVDFYRPKAIVVEKLYSHYRHPTTLGVLAQVKGVIALLAYEFKLEYCEFSSTRARKALLGRGNVNSAQVKRMAENVLCHKFKTIHTADAFSLVSAYCHDQKFSNKFLSQK